MAEEEEPRTRSSEPPPEDDESEEPQARRRRIERLLRETIRRGLEAGIGTISRTDSAVREVLGDVKLPREVASYVFSQIDDTKNALVRVVAREVRDFLEATDLATELQRALTSLSFEIKTEVRFIPNDAGTGVRPDVRSKAAPRRKRPAEDSEPPPDEPVE